MTSSPPSYSSGELRKRVAEMSVRIRYAVPGICRIELSKWEPKVSPPFEERRKDPERQRCRDEKRVALQGADDHLTQLPRLGALLRKLAVVLNDAGLVAGRDPPIHPGRAVHHFPAMGDLLLVEDRGNVDNHLLLSPRT
jgi:hypothetical protein